MPASRFGEPYGLIICFDSTANGIIKHLCFICVNLWLELNTARTGLDVYFGRLDWRRDEFTGPKGGGGTDEAGMRPETHPGDCTRQRI